MSFTETTINPQDRIPDDRDQHALDDEFFTLALKEMVSLGIDIARIIHQQVVAQSIDSPHSPIPEGTSLAFERVSRAVRRTIMLARKLAEPAKPSSACSKAPHEGAATPAQPRPPRPETEPPETEPPYADLRDRLDTPDFLESLEDRPILEIINDIRKDLNLPPLPRRASPGGNEPAGRTAPSAGRPMLDARDARREDSAPHRHPPVDRPANPVDTHGPPS